MMDFAIIAFAVAAYFAASLTLAWLFPKDAALRLSH